MLKSQHHDLRDFQVTIDLRTLDSTHQFGININDNA